MKALSIKQPWASLIAHGIKDVENRTWATKKRERVFIHSSAKFAGDINTLFSDDQWHAMGEEMRCNMVMKNFVFSAIIGEVDIIDCVINHDSIWAETTPFCPITGLKYFAEIADENGNTIPTYGGPFDSYTIPQPDEDFKGEYYRTRFCHDRGYWMGDETISKLTGIPKERKPVYNWVLANPVLYDEPILNVKGKLSFWEFNK